MAAKSDTWMPLYIADYLRKTMRLTRDQHGGYFLLLMACWDGGGRIPNDPGQLAGITKSTPSEWKRLAPVLLPYFEIEGDYLTQRRVIDEHAKAARLSEARRETGSKGGRPRKQTESKPKPIGFDNENQDETPLQEPIGSTLTREGPIEPSLSGDEPPRASASPKRGREEPIPDGFPDATAIGEAEAWISEAGVVLSAPHHAKRFRNHASAKDRRERNWPAAWRGWVDIEIEKAPAAKEAQPLPVDRWLCPDDVREAFVAALGGQWTRSYVDHCSWRDVPDRALVPATALAGRKLVGEGRAVLSKLGLIVLEKAA